MIYLNFTIIIVVGTKRRGRSDTAGGRAGVLLLNVVFVAF